MKPLELTIIGLNSFEEEQRINFEELISQGLFGIFGPTGSGKSSILDALIIALYDKIPRYESGSNRNFINLNSDVMTVSFKFSLEEDSAKYYLVERSYKKWKDSYKPVFVRLSYFSPEASVLGEKANDINKKIIELIGLNYDDFVRAVIIPQGKFSEFLHLENKERRTMLERIFRLEDYGEKLLKRVRNELSKVRGEFDRLNASLQLFGELSEEGLLAAESELQKLEAQCLSLKIQKDAAGKAYAVIKEAWEAELERRSYARAGEALEEESEKIRRTESALKQAEAVESIRPVIKQQSLFRGKINAWKTELEVIDKDFTKVVSERGFAREIYEKAVALRENTLPELLKKEEKLAQALALSDELKRAQNEHASLQKTYKAKRKDCAKAEAEAKTLADSIAAAELESEALRKKKEELSINLEERAEVESLAAAEEKLNEREKEKAALTAKAQTLAKQKEKAGKDVYIAAGILEGVEKETAKTQEEILKGLLCQSKRLSSKLALAKAEEDSAAAELSRKRKEKEELSAAIALLEKSNLAAHLAESLAEGEHCPVCGATEHPIKARAAAENFLNEQRAGLAKLNGDCDDLDKALREIQKNIVAIEGEGKAVRERLDSDKAEFGIPASNEAFENEDFGSEDFEPENFESEQSEKRSALITLREKSRGIAVKRARLAESLEGLKKQREENSDALSALEDEKAKLLRILSEASLSKPEGGFIALLKMLRQKEETRRKVEVQENELNAKLRLWNKEKESAQSSLLFLREELAQIETSGKEKALALSQARERMAALCEGGEPQRELEACKSQMAKLAADEAAAKKFAEDSESKAEKLTFSKRDLEKSISDTNNLMEENRGEIDSLLLRLKIDSEAGLTYYLDIDKDKLRREIKAYEAKVSEVASNLKRLSEKLLPYAALDIEAEARLCKNKAESLAASSEESGQSLAVKRKDFEEMKGNLKRCAELKEKLDKTQKTMDMLKELSDLFAGKAFVEFVAKKQLGYITAETSKRLRMITGGRYSLELLEADFIVRDNLNGGLTRSPRTLSGGETFVVSLCLALALSSRIQMKNSASLDLFFLDEGFGSLDPLTLETVLDSLEKLKQENLTVGLITHVEELKNRIGSRLNVIPAVQGLHGTLVRNC